MHPELFRLGPFALHSYGLLVFLGFAFGIWFASKRAERLGIPKELVTDVSLWILVSSLVGARGLYVLTHTHEFEGRWLDTISPIQSDGTIGIAGLVLLGGVILATVAVILYSYRRKISVWIITDLFVPSLALGEFFGRVGCYLNGCCFGLPTQLPWGVVFPTTCVAGVEFPDTHIHPTQLYMSIAALLTFFLLLKIDPKLKRSGHLFGVYLFIYGVVRFVIEDIRFYESSMILIRGGELYLTVSQVISISMVIAGLWVLFSKRLPLKLTSKSPQEPLPKSNVKSAKK